MSSCSPAEVLVSSIAISTPNGPRLFCGSSAGAVRSFDGEAQAVTHSNAGASAVRFLTAVRVRSEWLVVASCADRTIRVFDEGLRPHAFFDTPDAMLGVDAAVSSRGIEILSGAQHDPRVYLWNLEQVVRSGDATPRLTLTGGSAPAYAACFLPGGDRTWVAHGAWDGRLHLYDLERADSRTLSPVRTFHAHDPLYALTAFEFLGMPFVIAGGEHGTLNGWGLDPSDGTSRLQMRFPTLPNAIKSLRAVRVGPSKTVIVFAACRDGSAWQVQPDDPSASQPALGRLPPCVGSIDVLESR